MWKTSITLTSAHMAIHNVKHQQTDSAEKYCECKQSGKAMVYPSSFQIEEHILQKKFMNVNNVEKFSVLPVPFKDMKEIVEEISVNVNDVVKSSEISLIFEYLKELIVQTSYQCKQ
jgi:hypothetical protein